MQFVLSTDTSCDEPRSLLRQNNIPYLPLTFTINGETFFDEFSTDAEFAQFYQRIKNGAMPTTSQINPAEHLEFFLGLIKKGAKEIVHLSLSGGLSNTAANAKMAAQEAMQLYPDVKIYAIDTISATQAHNYLLFRANQLRQENKSAQQTAQEIDRIKNHLQTRVMAEDLMHLKRGGRIGGAKAAIGTLLKIKPIFVINKTGGLSVVDKIKGVKNVFKYFINCIKQDCDNFETVDFYIAHADCIDYATELKNILIANGNKGKIEIGWIGPVVGAHTGAGTLGVIWMGKERYID